MNHIYKNITSQKKGDNKYWVARVVFTAPGTRKKHDLQRRAKTKKEAQLILDKLVVEIRETAGRSINHDKATFNDYAEHYKKLFVKPVQIRDGAIVDGMRSPKSALGEIAALSKHFGDRLLRSITYEDLVNFKTISFETPTRYGKPMAVSTFMDRYGMLARMLGRAKQLGWIARNPCEDGPSLTNKLVRKVRERILSREEEIILLRAFRNGPSVMCSHNKFFDFDLLLKMGLDTGQRMGEMLKAQWKNVDLTRRFIFVPKEITKPFRQKHVPISERLAIKLEVLMQELQSTSRYNPEGYIFGGLKYPWTTWVKKIKDAGLSDINIHDLRRTLISRVSSTNDVSDFDLTYVAGHAVPLKSPELKQTFKYYIGTWETAARVKKVVDAINSETERLLPTYDPEVEQAKRQKEFEERFEQYRKNHQAGVERARSEGRTGRAFTWPVEKRDEIIRLYDEEGLTYDSIGERLEIASMIVGNVIRKAIANGDIEKKDIRRTQLKGVGREEEVVKLYDEGLGKYRIAEKTGLGLSTVRRILERTPHQRKGEYTAYKSKGKEAQILKLYGQGKNFSQIGELVQLSKNTVSIIVRAAIKEGTIKPLTAWQKRRLELGCTVDRAKGKEEEIIRLYDELELSYREIGVRVDLSALTVMRIVHKAIKDGKIKEAKDQFRVMRAKGKCVGREAEILGLREQGYSVPQIVAATGLSTGVLYYFLSNHPKAV